MSKEQWIEENLKPGEQYAGLILGKEGVPDHHLICLPGETEDVTHEQAIAWASTISSELPTRREQALLFLNLKEQFKPGWYWSCEQHAASSNYAWAQDFNCGSQGYYGKDYDLRARAVRRIYIKE